MSICQQAFADSGQQPERFNKSLLVKVDGKRYAPGKWTVNENFQLLML